MRSQIPTEVTVSLAVPEELLIWVDKQRMQQVVKLKNAVHAVGCEGKINLHAKKTQAPRAVLFQTEDNGVSVTDVI